MQDAICRKLSNIEISWEIIVYTSSIPFTSIHVLFSLFRCVFIYIYIYIYRYILYIYSYTVKGIHMNNDDMLYASHLKFIEADEVFLTCFTTKINQVATNVKNFKKL